MLKTIKKSAIKLSIVTSLALTPSIVLGASGGGFVEGSSESTSAMIESPNFEGQLVRINTGINLIRINTDILENMPISADSEWVDKVIAELEYNEVVHMEAVQTDVYYSTVGFTNAILGRATISLSPLGARLYQEAGAIYKKVPDMNVFPDLSDTKTFVTFADAKLINVEAKTSNRYDNVEMATISLLPEDMQESVKEALQTYKEAKESFSEAKSKIGSIENWLDDDANEDSPQTDKYEEDLKLAEADADLAENTLDEKADIYFELLSKGAEAIESNYDESKLALATKLEKLLDTVDNDVIGEESMFVSATAGLVRGIGVVDKELDALHTAASLHPVAAAAVAIRLKRMGVGALMALPNIGIGTYYAFKQSSAAGKYQEIVDKVIEGAEVAAEAAEAAAELKKEKASKK